MLVQGPFSNRMLGNKYLLGELQGEGGFGSVYKAQHVLLKRPQAIKVLREKFFYDAKFRERFIREAQVLATLNHANILPVHDFGLEGDLAYLVMPFISGGTLESILGRKGKLSLKDTEHYLKQICAALGYAHKQHVVHLDLKPLNLLHQDGVLLLSDFGLAHLMQEGAVEGGTSLRVGSPHYMAPEHIKGHPQKESDIYAVGVILYRMLTGNLPFEGTNPLSVAYQQVNEPMPPIRKNHPELPATLEAVVAKTLAKKPEERPQTAEEILKDFQAALSAPSVMNLRQSEPLPDPGVWKAVVRNQDQAAPPKAPAVQFPPVAPPKAPADPGVRKAVMGNQNQAAQPKASAVQPSPVTPSKPPAIQDRSRERRNKREDFIRHAYSSGNGAWAWIFALSFLSGLGAIVCLLTQSQTWALESVGAVALLIYLLGYRKAMNFFTMVIVVALACAATFGFARYVATLSPYTQPYMSQLWLVGIRHLWLGKQIDWGIGIGAFWPFSFYFVTIEEGRDDDLLIGLWVIGVVFGLGTWLILAVLAGIFGWGFGFGFGWGEGLIALGIGIVGGMGLADAFHICWSAFTA